MKKLLYLSALAASATIISCNQETKTSSTSTTTTTQSSNTTAKGSKRTFQFVDVRKDESAKGGRASYITFSPYGNFDIQTTYGQIVPLATAIIDTYRYDTSVLVDNKTYSFVFDTGDLHRYLYDSRTAILELRMAKNAGGDIYLVLTSQDFEGGHIYLRDNANVCNVFASNTTLPTGLTTKLEGGTQTKVRGMYYTGKPIIKANQWITDYYNYTQQQGAKRFPTTTWTYSSETLLKYICSAQKVGAKYIQFILCKEEHGFMDLVICAVDENNNHLYFSQNGSASVLENCDPCPECEINSLEACQ